MDLKFQYVVAVFALHFVTSVYAQASYTTQAPTPALNITGNFAVDVLIIVLIAVGGVIVIVVIAFMCLAGGPSVATDCCIKTCAGCADLVCCSDTEPETSRGNPTSNPSNVISPETTEQQPRPLTPIIHLPLAPSNGDV